MGDTKKELNPVPKILLMPGVGLIGVGNDKKSANIVADIGETLNLKFSKIPKRNIKAISSFLPDLSLIHI